MIVYLSLEKMSLIKKIHAREILDSRGNPTLEVECHLDSEIGRAAVPSGASKGKHEAHELRDEDFSRYQGRGVLSAVSHVRETISPFFSGKRISSQAELDSALIELDGSQNKKRLGANTLLAVSLAYARAQCQNKEPLFKSLRKNWKDRDQGAFRLPIPLMNLLNGGAHANNSLDIQEFLIVPAFGDSFKEAFRSGCEVFQSLKDLLKEKNLSTAVGDEGGFAPQLSSNEEALRLLTQAIEGAKYRPGEDIFLALDVASTELFDGQAYLLDHKIRSSDELGEIYSRWMKNFPLISLEDPFSEDDWGSWSKWTKAKGRDVQVVGDDLFVTHPERIKRGLEETSANAVLIKMNQIGSLTETQDSVLISRGGNLKTILSHRSGETEDTSIADFSVALDCEQIKTGAPSRGERVCKYNQLLRIEESLGDRAEYWGYKRRGLLSSASFK